MSLKEEIEVHDKVSQEVWDRVIFPNVIRSRENELLLSQANKVKPKRVLDFGCGSGWLSKLLALNGYSTVGIDVSSSLIKNATRLSNKRSSFVTGDCMNLPFKDSSFDLIAGVGILHHLEPIEGLIECRRVISDGGTLILMEPNKLNPLAWLGRIISPLETQTTGEKPFTPRELIQAIGVEWTVLKADYLFPFSFALAFLLNKTRWRANQKLRFVCPFIKALDRLFERIPYLNRLCWVIFVVAKRETAP